MKANEAPEKIYCETDGLGNIVKAHNQKWPDGEAENIEYTRTDAFIGKACEWLKDNITYIHPRKGTEECIINLTRFRDYMKGE